MGKSWAPLHQGSWPGAPPHPPATPQDRGRRHSYPLSSCLASRLHPFPRAPGAQAPGRSHYKGIKYFRETRVACCNNSLIIIIAPQSSRQPSSSLSAAIEDRGTSCHQARMQECARPPLQAMTEAIAAMPAAPEVPGRPDSETADQVWGRGEGRQGWRASVPRVSEGDAKTP